MNSIIEDFIPLAQPDISQEEIDLVIETIKSGWLTTGPKVMEFEERLCNYLCHGDSLYGVGLNSCTSALFLALLALDVKAGDEVIVPTWTFAATAQVVEWTGAKLILCDVENESLNIDLGHAERLISDRTKVIIPVHMAGYPCDMEGVARLARKYDLKVVEDAAHAIGTRFDNKKIGNFSDVTCFSFYATKNLAMGEGGAAVSKDQNIIERIRKLSYFGINKEAFRRYEKKGHWFYDIEELGYKSNLDSIHAAIGIVQLAKLDKMNERRREIAAYYRSELSGKVEFSVDSAQHYHSYHLFQIRLPVHVGRDHFIESLRESNIGASVHFIPLHRHKFYRDRSSNEFCVADVLFKKVISIPMCSAMSDYEVEYVVDSISRILGEN